MAVNIAIFDVTTHTWDLAKATGQSTDLDPETVGIAYEVAQTMLSDDWRNAGMFGQPVAVADDAPVPTASPRSPVARRSGQSGSASASGAHFASQRVGDRRVRHLPVGGVHAGRELGVVRAPRRARRASPARARTATWRW